MARPSGEVAAAKAAAKARRAKKAPRTADATAGRDTQAQLTEGEVQETLSRRELLIAFASEPTGLGHLRVTHALREGLPPAAGPVLLGAEKRFLDVLHRISSLRPWARRMFEYIQYGAAEDIVTSVSRRLLVQMAPMLRDDLTRLVVQRLDRPAVLLAVATHFGLAHQLAALKPWLWDQKRIRLFVAVQVTDDSPQHIWLVPNADLIAVPSERTRLGLVRYAQELGVTPPPFVVAPYPIAPELCRPLSARGIEWRGAQLDPRSTEPIRMAVPISGAGVGMAFLSRLMGHLREASDRYSFEVVSRHNPYTFPFLTGIIHGGAARVQASGDDRDVVRAYERVYQSTVVSLEVTKPSEQCFKALLGPDLRGGALLLLTHPVGRQEYDNLDFLTAHGLLPTGREQDALWRLASGRKPPGPSERLRLFEAARHWRALRLPGSARRASAFIQWCLEEGLFTRMLDWVPPAGLDRNEVSPNGVREFWAAVATHVSPLLAASR